MSYPTAVDILREWLRVEAHLGYYRVQTHDGICVAYYDLRDRSGVYWMRESNEILELANLEPLTMPWDSELDRLHGFAAGLDTSSSISAKADAFSVVMQ